MDKTDICSNFYMNLYFRNKTDKSEIGGHLKVAIEQIPGLNVDAEGEVDMTNVNKEITSALRLDFYGNALVESPTTFEDAVRVYQTLPEKANMSQSVVRFSLSPITDYCDESTTILNQISSNSVKEVSM